MLRGKMLILMKCLVRILDDCEDTGQFQNENYYKLD